MHEWYVTDETWAFACRSCGNRWSVAYEVRRTDDHAGGELCLWRRRGLPNVAPEAGMPCPRCGGLSVSVTRPEPPSVRRGPGHG